MDSMLESLEQRLITIEEMLAKLLARTENPENDGGDIIGDLEDCSRWIKRSQSTIYKMTSQRRIPHIKNGKCLLFKKSDVYAWLEKDRQLTMDEFISDVDGKLQQHAKSPWKTEIYK